MDPRLQEMLDHHEITKLLYEYCHGCDRMDETRMARVYARQSWDDHGPEKCPGPEFAARTMKGLKATNMCVHLMGQSLIRITGDEAGAESHFIATNRIPTAEGGETLDQIGGRYVDTLVRENGHWRIKTRICIRDWSISHPLEQDWLEGKGFVAGQRSNEDPSFAVLGLVHSGVPVPGSRID
jgi:SnoaL-like domain